MKLTFNRIDKATFDRDIYKVLEGLEEQGQAKSGIYFDSKGNATTGIGFNLRSAETVKDLKRDILSPNKLLPKTDKAVIFSILP